MPQIKRVKPYVVALCEVRKGNSIYDAKVCITSSMVKGRKRFGYVPENLRVNNKSLEESDVLVNERVAVLKVKGCLSSIEATLAKVSKGLGVTSNDSSKPDFL